MSDTNLRWGLGMGTLAAVIGLTAQFVGGWFKPPTNPTTVDREVQYIIIAGLLSLAALGATLGLAYYAGLRSARDRTDEPSWSIGDSRREAAWAGAMVAGAYWLGTTLAMLLAPRHNGDPTAGDIAGRQLIVGIIFILFGYGLGALGGRAPAARSLLNEITGGARATPDVVSPAVGEPPSSQDDSH